MYIGLVLHPILNVQLASQISNEDYWEYIQNIRLHQGLSAQNDARCSGPWVVEVDQAWLPLAVYVAILLSWLSNWWSGQWYNVLLMQCIGLSVTRQSMNSMVLLRWVRKMMCRPAVIALMKVCSVVRWRRSILSWFMSESCATLLLLLVALCMRCNTFVFLSVFFGCWGLLCCCWCLPEVDLSWRHICCAVELSAMCWVLLFSCSNVNLSPNTPILSIGCHCVTTLCLVHLGFCLVYAFQAKHENEVGHQLLDMMPYLLPVNSPFRCCEEWNILDC